MTKPQNYKKHIGKKFLIVRYFGNKDYAKEMKTANSVQLSLFIVNRKAMIRNEYNRNKDPTLNTKGERRTHTKFDKRPRKTRTVNQMNSYFLNRWSFSNPN